MYRPTLSSIVLITALIAPCTTLAYDMVADPFDTLSTVSTTPAKNALSTACVLPERPTSPLRLIDAMEWALCNNPQTQMAWTTVKAQAAAVGSGWSAYLPTVNVSSSISQNSKSNRYTDQSMYSTDVNPLEINANINLNWVLYDFGLRAANLESARQLLNAASASQDDTLQTVFFNTAQAYYEAQAAQALLDANLEAEHAAEKSFKAAAAKYSAGVGSLADKLQAQTSHAQAVSKRVQSEGDLKTALGAVNVLMGLQPNINLSMSSINQNTEDAPLFQQAVEHLMDQAVQGHPKILAAKAQAKAAEAKMDMLSAEGRPRLSLTASNDYFNTNATPINNQGSSEQTVDSQRVGLQVDIPLFEGFGRHYKVREAEFQLANKQAELNNMEQQIALEVWKSYQALQTGAENLKASDTLVVSAQQSFDVAQGRYQAGVGNILELLKSSTVINSPSQMR